MDAVILTYDGGDLVIPHHDLEELGVKPGDKVVIRPQFRLKRRTFEPGELEELQAILKELEGSWSKEDEAEFNDNRRMWDTWKPRDWS